MHLIKRIIILLVCLITAFCGFITGAYGTGLFFVYADSEPSGYTAISDNEKFTQCFLAYCRSRDTDIVGGVPNAVTTFTYSSIVKAASSLGIDLTRLQSELFYKQEANQGIQWFMTATGVSAFNELFAQLITDAGLEVGDSNVNENLYSGQYFVDADGIGCLVYEADSYVSLNQTFTSLGTPYKYTTQQIISNVGTTNATFTFNLYQNLTRSYTLYYYSQNYNSWGSYDYTSVQIRDSNQGINYGNVFYKVNTGTYQNKSFELECCKNSQYCIVNFSGVYYLCYLAQNISNNLPADSYDWRWYCNQKQQLNGSNADTTDVNINIVTINNNTIKNEYQGDTTINNNGDTIINNNPSEPSDPSDPSDPSGPIDYDPYPDGGGTTTGPNSPNDPNGSDNLDINFPNLDIDLPSINWSIGDLSHKFPFSIPFDLVSLVNVLDAEPVAPRFQGTVNFGFTTWNYDINLQQFDTVAAVSRTASLIGFIFGLIFITRSIIKG